MRVRFHFYIVFVHTCILVVTFTDIYVCVEKEKDLFDWLQH